MVLPNSAHNKFLRIKLWSRFHATHCIYYELKILQDKIFAVTQTCKNMKIFNFEIFKLHGI